MSVDHTLLRSIGFSILDTEIENGHEKGPVKNRPFSRRTLTALGQNHTLYCRRVEDEEPQIFEYGESD